MKLFITLLLLGWAGQGFAQATNLNRSFPLSKGQVLELNVDYPDLVVVSSWKNNTVALTGSVDINRGNNNDAFLVEEENEAGKLRITTRIKDMDKLPRTYLRYGPGADGKKEELVFNSQADWEAYRRNNPKQENVYYGNTLQMKIQLELKVPEGTTLLVKAKYGMVELRDFTGPITVDAPYGGIDVAMAAEKIGSITLTTKFGKIFTNQSLPILQSTEKDFYTSITAGSGKGPTLSFTSTYGNIYFRKP